MKRGKLWKIRNSVSLLFRLWLVFKFSRGLLRRNWKSNHPCIRRKFIVNFSSLWRNRINPPLFNHYSWVESYKIASLSEIFLLNFNFWINIICIRDLYPREQYNAKSNQYFTRFQFSLLRKDLWIQEFELNRFLLLHEN